MKLRRIRILGLAAVLAMVLFALAGCQSGSAASSSSEDAASQNRAYMAQLEQRMADIQTELQTFQDDVSEADVVGMKAQVQAVGRIVEQVRETDATDALSDVKDAYVQGLDTLDAALNDYVQLYADVAAGGVDDASYQARLANVQAAYDAGIAQLQAADDKVKSLTSGE